MMLFLPYWSHVRGALVLSVPGLGVALAVQPVHAQSAGAPPLRRLNTPQLATAVVSPSSEARSVQGASSGIGGKLRWGKFSLGCGGNRSIAPLESGLSSVAVEVQGTRLRNVAGAASSVSSNSLANGGSLNGVGASIY